MPTTLADLLAKAKEKPRSPGRSVDASSIEADANRFSRIDGAQPAWSDARRQTWAVREYLKALDTEQLPNHRGP